MLIRSQKRGTIVILENLKNLYIDGNNRIMYDSENYLGIYSTLEKSIKVLDMIQNEYLNEEYDDFECGIRIHIKENKVFQMPLDEEVIL